MHAAPGKSNRGGSEQSTAGPQGRGLTSAAPPVTNAAMRRPLAVAALLAALAGCRTPSRAPASPEAALHALVDAARAGDLAKLYGLLDTPSRWSLMSVYKDQLKLCGLVRAHYPKERQRNELARCRLADGARDVESLFSTWARERGLAATLAKLPAAGKPSVAGERATLPGAPAVILCREGEGWLYCGLRDELERLKLKAARDMATIQENVEAYRGR
jgi:hypothetical protein